MLGWGGGGGGGGEVQIFQGGTNISICLYPQGYKYIKIFVPGGYKYFNIFVPGGYIIRGVQIFHDTGAGAKFSYQILPPIISHFTE